MANMSARLRLVETPTADPVGEGRHGWECRTSTIVQVNMAPPDPPLLTIGAVAERSGLAPSALRFYERHHLISTVRSDGGQRRYHRDVLRRLAVIRAAQHVGFSLAEIGEMLDRFPDGHR